MKNILIMRHAKSNWSNAQITDYERSLNERGMKDAPMMGQQILQRGKNIDLIICSAAKRAATTAQLLARAIGYDQKIQMRPDFYSANEHKIFYDLYEINDTFNTVLLIAHNPTMEYLTSLLIKNDMRMTFPTAAVASIVLPIDSWANLSENIGQLEWFIKPKDFKVPHF